MDVEKNSEGVSVKLNSKLYSLTALKKSLADFGDVCTGEVVNKENVFVVKLNPKNQEIDAVNLAHEFCNYVVGIMKDLDFQ